MTKQQKMGIEDDCCSPNRYLYTTRARCSFFLLRDERKLIDTDVLNQASTTVRNNVGGTSGEVSNATTGTIGVRSSMSTLGLGAKLSVKKK